jgi:uncharacterized protein YajQ (UPF0234 family)
VSEVDLHEIRNAVDQANREVGQRFDFKGVDARFELHDGEIVLQAESEFHLQQMTDILHSKMAKRRVDIQSLDPQSPEQGGKVVRQHILVRQGVDSDLARRMVKDIKGTKVRVQTQIQGEQLRVSGKKRDDLQQVIAFLREQQYDIPLQFTNFRD